MVAIPVPQKGASPAPPRGPLEMDCSVFESAGSGRIHFRGRGEPGSGAATRWELWEGDPALRAGLGRGRSADSGTPWGTAARCHGARRSAQSLCVVGV